MFYTRDFFAIMSIGKLYYRVVYTNTIAVYPAGRINGETTGDLPRDT